MKTIILLLMLVSTAASAQHEYLRIYQVAYSPKPNHRGEIQFDFGVKYDSSKVYAKAVAPNNLVAAIEFAESKGWEYVTVFTEPNPDYNIINVLMKRKPDE